MTSGVFLALLALPLTLALMPVTWVLLRRLDLRDHPSARSSHVVPTLRGGGVGPALAAVVVGTGISQLVGLQLLALVLGAGLFGLIGVAEDVKGVAPLKRLVLQLSAAVVAATAVAYSTSALFAPTTFVLFVAAMSLWLVSYTNAFNFMDGINGISAAQAAVAGLGYAAMGLSADAPVLVAGGIIVAGAGLGFLPFNFPRATLFLGDSGSYFFGGWIGMLAVIGLWAGLPTVAVVAPVVLYVADTGTTLAGRVVRREPWHLPHKSHVYQRLTGKGWSHARVTAAVTVLTSSCIAFGVWAMGGASERRLVAACAIALIVSGYLLAPRIVDLRRHRQSRRFAAGSAAQIDA